MIAAIFDLDRTLLRPAWRSRLGLRESAAAALEQRLRRHARPLLFAHRRCGHVTVLLSGQSAACADRLGRLLAADVVLTVPRDLAGWTRLAAVLEFFERYQLSAPASYAYASRDGDASWLEMVGHPAAANPTWGLRRRARISGWRLLDLDSPQPPPP